MLNQDYLGKYNFLFVVLDSCRYDLYKKAQTPNMDQFCKPQLCYSPGFFTLPSHVAMFRGNLPSNFKLKGYYNRRDFIMFRLGGEHLNPLFGRKVGINFDGHKVADLPDGFKQAGYYTIGIGGVHWFHPAYKTGKCIYYNFEHYYYDEQRFGVDNPASLKNQIEHLQHVLRGAPPKPKFIFINSSLTHMPYKAGLVQGAKGRDAQIKCVEKFDELWPHLLESVPKPIFVIVTADHGDLFGEDGMTGHPIEHPVLHKVPMMVFEVK